MANKDKEPIITQPTQAEQQVEASLAKNIPTVVRIKGTSKTYKIYWACNAQIEKLSRLLIRKADTDNDDLALSALHDAPTTDEAQSEADTKKLADAKTKKHVEAQLSEILSDRRLASKAAAIYVLHGYWQLLLLYPLLWRWFYYVKQYNDDQLQPILDEGKKKVPLTPFFAVTMSLTGAKATLMMMTTNEAERTLQELATVQQSQQPKSDLG